MPYNIIAHVDLKTVKQGPYVTETRARIAAAQAMQSGIWDDRRLYPPQAIVFIEVVEAA